MRIKINGRDIERGDRVTFESSEFSDGFGLIIVFIGIIAILWEARGFFL